MRQYPTLEQKTANWKASDLARPPGNIGTKHPSYLKAFFRQLAQRRWDLMHDCPLEHGEVNQLMVPPEGLELIERGLSYGPACVNKIGQLKVKLPQDLCVSEMRIDRTAEIRFETMNGQHLVGEILPFTQGKFMSRMSPVREKAYAWMREATALEITNRVFVEVTNRAIGHCKTYAQLGTALPGVEHLANVWPEFLDSSLHTGLRRMLERKTPWRSRCPGIALMSRAERQVFNRVSQELMMLGRNLDGGARLSPQKTKWVRAAYLYTAKNY